jgi:type I restriction enzyme S subunit
MDVFPPEWMVDRLKDVCLTNPRSLSTNTDPDFEFPYLEISNVDYFGIVDEQAIERLRFEDAPSRARRVVFQNCTIISSVRPNLQAIAFFPDSPNGLICSTGFNVIRPEESKLMPKFFYYVAISDYARQYFEATATGVGYPAVADKYFGAIPLPIPDLNEQALITAFLDETCQRLDSTASLYSSNGERLSTGVLNRQIQVLFAYRKSLIHECVTGQRRISETDLHHVQAHA